MPTIEEVWELLKTHENQQFKTSKGLPFYYVINGGELFVDRRAKSITISTVAAALRLIEQRMEKGEAITGPKKIGCYGASYLYPIFKSLGLLPSTSTDPEQLSLL